MRNLPVHWSEGLFLRPHHFQAADRHWTEATQDSQQWDHPYHYGLRAVELSEEAIANHQVQLNSCRARMKDGTLVSLDPGQEPDRVDLKEAFDRESVIRVFLAIPKLKMGSVNVAPAEEPSKSRYVQQVQSSQDEDLGGNDQEVRFRELNVRLMLSTQDTSGYDLLPIAQVQRAGEKGATPRIDDQYFPPVLACDAWPPLGRDMVRAIYDIIGQKIEILSAQVLNRGISLASQQPGDLDRVLMLSELNRAYATLNILAFARGIHPLEAYTECCRIIGQLSIFGVERRVVKIPRYDHDDLYTIFAFARRQIQFLLDSLPDYEYEQEYFQGEGLGMSVALKPKMVGQRLAMVRRRVARRRFDGRGVHELTHGGRPRLEARQRDPSRRPVPVRGRGPKFDAAAPSPPGRCPPRAVGSTTRSPVENAAWKDVLQTQTLAMRVSDVLIVNRDTLQGKRELVVRVGPQQVPLQFALFAVPNAPSAS